MVEILNKDIFNGVAGKRSGKPKGVVIHNDAGSKNATAKWYMNNFLPNRKKVNQSSSGFAHYYIDRNTIGRCENTNNKAWHTANTNGNANYIGYEVCQSIGESVANFRENEEMTFRQVAEDLQFYGLKANRDTIKLHKQFTSTSCPHRSVELHGDNTKVQDYFIERVNYYISLGKTVNDMLKKVSEPVAVIKPVAVAKPAVKSTVKANLKVDGYFGYASIKALQAYFKTPQDGKISEPSMVVKSLQKLVGAKVDGYWGANTTKALQKRFGTPQDGIISKPSMVIKELQRRLNAGKL